MLERIRERLGRGEPCRVVSTQLVEAGVDIDFPVVYRALAGLDALAQAAGRCNRNGRLPRGQTYVFETDRRRQERFLADTADAARQILGNGRIAPLYQDLLSPEAIEHYFRLYYWSRQDEWDGKDILRDALTGKQEMPFLFHFRTVAERFRLIEDRSANVLIPWKEGAALCERLRRGPEWADMDLLRRLQRYAVQVSGRIYEQALGRDIELVHDRYPVLVSPELHYDDRVGLVLDREEPEAGDLIV